MYIVACSRFGSRVTAKTIMYDVGTRPPRSNIIYAREGTARIMYIIICDRCAHTHTIAVHAACRIIY